MIPFEDPPSREGLTHYHHNDHSNYQLSEPSKSRQRLRSKVGTSDNESSSRRPPHNRRTSPDSTSSSASRA